jgi:hypothetical protein
MSPAMPDEKETPELAKVQNLAKSKILERIAETVRTTGGLAAATMYTKSDGTNYGMYQKEDDLTALGDIWQRVFEAGKLVETSAERVVLNKPTRK